MPPDTGCAVVAGAEVAGLEVETDGEVAAGVLAGAAGVVVVDDWQPVIMNAQMRIIATGIINNFFTFFLLFLFFETGSFSNQGV